MHPSLRALSLAAALAGGLSLGARPAAAATQIAQVSATVAKPLILTRVQDLDLGSITLGPGTWSNATVGISRTGTFSCASANLICTGATKPAIYNVSGTNNRIVRIIAPNVTMVNQANPSQTLTLVTDVAASVTLTNSGPPGTDFDIGGTIALSSSTPSGTYSGTFNVTVDY